MKKTILTCALALAAISAAAQTGATSFVDEVNARFDQRMNVIKEKETDGISNTNPCFSFRTNRS